MVQCMNSSMGGAQPLAGHSTPILEIFRLTFGIMSSVDFMTELANNTLDLSRLAKHRKEPC